MLFLLVTLFLSLYQIITNRGSCHMLPSSLTLSTDGNKSVQRSNELVSGETLTWRNH
jgi:hypothetical protein